MDAKTNSAAPDRRIPNALIAILAGLVIFEMTYDWEKAISPDPNSTEQPTNSILAVSAVDLQDSGPDFRAYLQSPALDRDRTPIRLLLPSSGKTTSATIDGITLVGTLITGQERWAVFQLQGRQDSIRVGPGQNVSDWTVLSIEPGRVMIERPGRTEELALTSETK